ncbi:MAG: hypothetical protein FJ098_02450 [Deltaproteobacteria bacterium]|nr:hypothetical protein [Deltaproteobacteria bacterium]
MGVLLAIGGCGSSGGAGRNTAPDSAPDAARDAGQDLTPDAGTDPSAPLPPKPFRELLGGEITQKVRFVFDLRYQGEVDEDVLRDFVLSRRIREADPYTTLTAAPDWWNDYQDFSEILYYSSEHVFGPTAPYPGATFMPHVWDDVVYRVRKVTVEYADLTEFYGAVETRKRMETEPEGTTWNLLNANDGMAWARQRFPHGPDEMVVVVTYNESYRDAPYSYYFLEEDYGAARGFGAHYFNTTFHQWPGDMQVAEGLEPHDLPIWMHFAFLNGEWDQASGRWRLFQSTRWGGYEDAGIYFIEGIRDFHRPSRTCDPVPAFPESHFANDEAAFKECLGFTERLQYDWHRLWRHAFNIPSFPFWWTEKMDLRVVVVDLREYVDGVPEYAEDDVVDWTTFEDSVREANPFVHLAVQRFDLRPPDELRDVLVAHLFQEAEYPMHARVGLPLGDGSWEQFTMDWHYHIDISGLPGMQVYLADRLREYWGGVDGDGRPAQYDPFAGPYSRTGKPFVVPAIFFLTPHHAFDGRLGGWTANTGKLMCILASQFGLTCDQVLDLFDQLFGGPVGPNLNAWSDAYGLWWEVFVVDWTYTSSPVKTLRWLLDPDAFHDFLAEVPEVGELLNLGASQLYDQLFGQFHPWATGFPFWLRESLSDPRARELTRQFASYQFAETIQHNIGYKHQTTVIFDCPYLGMAKGFDYRKHRDLAETFEMTAEEISMPFYSTEPGSRDFPIDANSYMTHKMGAGTRHVLQRIFARRQVVALWERIEEMDPSLSSPDPSFQEALAAYLDAARAALDWRHEAAYSRALEGLQAADRYWTERGEPDRVHTDWDAATPFEPAATGLDVTPDQLEKDLLKIRGGQ